MRFVFGLLSLAAAERDLNTFLSESFEDAMSVGNASAIAEVIFLAMDHIEKDDCKGLKGHIHPMALSAVSSLDSFVDEFGQILGQNNAIVIPMVMMAKSYLLENTKGHIDTIVDDHLCETFINQLSDGMKKIMMPALRKTAVALTHPKHCNELKAAMREVKDHAKKALVSTANTFFQEMLVTQPQMVPIITMAQQFAVASGTKYVENLIDDKLCDFVYENLRDEF